MKKFYFNTLLLAGLVLAACSSDDDDHQGQEEHQEFKTYYMTVNATKGAEEGVNYASTRALAFDGSTLNATWATTEHVYVQGQLVSSGEFFWFEGSLKPQSAGTETELIGAISLPAGWSYSSIDEAIGYHHEVTLQFPRPGVLDYTGQIGTLADIAEKYDYAIDTEVVVEITADQVLGVEYAVFESQQAIVKFTLKDYADGTTLLNPTKLNVQYGTESLSLTIPETTYTTNGNGVLYVAIPGFVDEQKVTLTAKVGSKKYTFIKSGVMFENGKYYEVDVKMKEKV